MRWGSLHRYGSRKIYEPTAEGCCFWNLPHTRTYTRELLLPKQGEHKQTEQNRVISQNALCWWGQKYSKIRNYSNVPQPKRGPNYAWILCKHIASTVSAAKSLQSEGQEFVELRERRYGQIYRRGTILQHDWVIYPRSPNETGIWTWLWLVPGQGCSLGVTPMELRQVPALLGGSQEGNMDCQGGVPPVSREHCCWFFAHCHHLETSFYLIQLLPIWCLLPFFFIKAINSVRACWGKDLAGSEFQLV